MNADDAAWFRAQTAQLQQARAARDARWRAWKARTEARLHAQRAQRGQAPAPAALPTSGPDWRVLATPHQALEALARDIWDLGFHGMPWPEGWRVRWAELSERERGGMVSTAARCDREHRLILVSETWHRRHDHRELVETLAHELVHIVHPGDSHGERFKATLERLRDYIRHEETAMPTLDPGYEYAMVKTAAGEPVPRPASLRSFQRAKAALAQAGGRPPRDARGVPMVWSEAHGWHERGA
jgi:hypothetical protein